MAKFFRSYFTLLPIFSIFSFTACTIADNDQILRAIERLQLRKGESRIPFPLLPAGSLPPVLSIPDLVLEPDSELLNGFLELGYATIFGLSELSVISDLSVDYNNGLIVHLNNTTAAVGQLVVTTIHETDLRLHYAIEGTPIVIDGHFLGHGSMSITINNLNVGLDVQLRLVENGQIVAEVLALRLDADSMLFGAQNFTVTFNEADMDPDELLELLKGFLPMFEQTILDLLNGLLNGLLENCSLADLLGLDLTCTGVFPAPPTEIPTTTPRPTPPTRDSGANWVSTSMLSIMAVQFLRVTLFG